MTSLDEHNRTFAAERHAGLAWRADCPICRRTRLAGPVPDNRLVSRRTKAALAAAIATGGGALPVAPASAQAPVPPAPPELVPPEGAGSQDSDSAAEPPGAGPVPAPTPPAAEGGVLPEPPAGDSGQDESGQGRGHTPVAPALPSEPTPPAEAPAAEGPSERPSQGTREPPER